MSESMSIATHNLRALELYLTNLKARVLPLISETEHGNLHMLKLIGTQLDSGERERIGTDIQEAVVNLMEANHFLRCALSTLDNVNWPKEAKP